MLLINYIEIELKLSLIVGLLYILFNLKILKYLI